MGLIIALYKSSLFSIVSLDFLPISQFISLTYAKNNGTLCEDFWTEFFLGWKIFSTKFLKKNPNALFMISSFSFWKSCQFVRKHGKIMQGQTGYRWQMKRRMRIAYWITKATNTHSENVITHCFNTTIMVTWTRLNIVFFFVRFPVLLIDIVGVLAEIRTGHLYTWKLEVLQLYTNVLVVCANGIYAKITRIL